MAKRKVFEGLNVKAYGFPTIGFEQFRVQSEVQSNLDARINNVLKFAVGKVEEQSKIDAYEYAASNPLTISEYLNSFTNARKWATLLQYVITIITHHHETNMSEP